MAYNLLPLIVINGLSNHQKPEPGPNLARQEVPILEYAQEVSDGEAAKHQTHGEHRRVGVGTVTDGGDRGDVACRIIYSRAMGDNGVPRICD